MDELLLRLTADEAREVLVRLCKGNGAILATAIAEARAMLVDVDVDEVAGEVFQALDAIDVHDLWDRAGPKRDGYIAPEDMAFEMVEEEIEPFLDRIRQYRELGMPMEERLTAMGVLKGLYHFDQESKSEFKDWATDIPGECFRDVLSLWRKGCKDKALLREMDQFVGVACPNWST